MKKVFYLFIFLLYSLPGCKSNSNQDRTFLTSFKVGPNLPAEDWNCLNIDNDKICVPKDWKMVHQSKYLFYSKLNIPDTNSYFVIIKYNETSTGLNVPKYLNLTYNALKKDTVEKFTGYTNKKLVFDDKNTYYGEYYTRLFKKPYITYSMVFENDNNLYELALKTDSASATHFQDVYKDILFNYQHNNKPIFSASDKIKDIQILDISKM